MAKHVISGKIKKFPGNSGWFYVSVPEKVTKTLTKPKWGLIPIEAELGSSVWRTSLMPMGDGSLFLALKASVRQKERVSIDDLVKVSFKLCS